MQIFVKLYQLIIKLSKTQISKIIQSGRFLGRLLGPLIKVGLPFMKYVFKPIAKRVLIPLGLIASLADPGILKKLLDRGKEHW